MRRREKMSETVVAGGKAVGGGDAAGALDPHLEEARGRWRIYLTVFVLLFVLTVSELYVNKIIEGKAGQVAILVVLMMSKATLVVLYYMHLRYESRVLRWVVLVVFFAAVFFVSILILV
jgi:caa(3)-type oxidase subunit IV